MALVQFNRFQCRQEGGIDHFLFVSCNDANYAPVFDVNGAVTSLGTGVTPIKVEPSRGMGYANSTPTGNAQNSTMYYAEEIQVMGHGSGTAVRSLIFELGRSSWHVVAVYNNGIKRLFGQQFGLMPTGGSDNSASASTDPVEFSMTLAGEELTPAPIVL